MDSILENEREVAAELAHRVVVGDPLAESELINRYSRGLRFLLRRKTRDTELAEDLLQDTWAVALEKMRQKPLDQPERLSGFLSGIARHLALNELRKTGRQRTSVSTDIINLVPDESANPMRQASRAEVCRHVRILLDELKQDRDRQILERFYVKEQEKEEICRKIGVDGSHFNRVLYRARQRLRDLLLRQASRAQLRVVN